MEGVGDSESCREQNNWRMAFTERCGIRTACGRRAAARSAVMTSSCGGAAKLALACAPAVLKKPVSPDALRRSALWLSRPVSSPCP
jgi:hypothetical protein